MEITKKMTMFRCGFSLYIIPDYMIEGLEMYINHGTKQGSFLHAVLCNDLKEAIRCADENNMAALPAYVNFLYNYAPAACFGSQEKVKAWMEKKQSNGGATST